MDIMVQGTGKKFYKPEKVEISLTFYTKRDEYQSALENGIRNVEIFIKEVFLKLGFEIEDLKTRSFKVYEETRYDIDLRQNVKDGYAYTQNARFEFEYSVEKMATFMDKVSRLENPPRYTVNFNIKNAQQCINEALAEAYKKAEEKARAIANAAGKNLKECVKIDFRPFEEKISSNSYFGNDSYLDVRNKSVFSRRAEVPDIITNKFTPEDIEITENLYCLWVAE